MLFLTGICFNFQMAATPLKIIERFPEVSSGQPVLYGHLLKKHLVDKETRRSIAEWATAQNLKNGYPPVTGNILIKCFRDYTKLKYSLTGRCKIPDFTQLVAHDICPSSTSSSSKDIAEISTNKVDYNSDEPDIAEKGNDVLLHKLDQQAKLLEHKEEQIKEMALKIQSQARLLEQLEEIKKQAEFLNEKIDYQKKLLQKQDEKITKQKQMSSKKIQDLEKELEDIKFKYEIPAKEVTLERKTYYACILNKVPTCNIPNLVETMCRFLNINTKEVLGRTTVERMVGELAYLADLQTAEAVIQSNSATLSFDATTQDGDQINCILLLTDDSSYLLSMETLAGGTAQDYLEHICEAVDSIARIYSSANKITFDQCKNVI